VRLPAAITGPSAPIVPTGGLGWGAAAAVALPAPPEPPAVVAAAAAAPPFSLCGYTGCAGRPTGGDGACPWNRDVGPVLYGLHRHVNNVLPTRVQLAFQQSIRSFHLKKRVRVSILRGSRYELRV
jgi:hypothetical protein